jgi:hypothetical protein
MGASGGNLAVKLNAFSLAFVLFGLSTFAMAQTQILQEREGIYVIVRDIQGEKVEGYLRLYPEEVLVTTQDNKEKSIPLKYIESIKLEKVQGSIAGADQPGSETYYSVRLQNSQEIYRLRNKYTFSLNASIGVVTKTIDPETIQDLFRKEGPSVIRDKGALFTLEFKF